MHACMYVMQGSNMMHACMHVCDAGEQYDGPAWSEEQNNQLVKAMDQSGDERISEVPFTIVYMT